MEVISSAGVDVVGVDMLIFDICDLFTCDEQQQRTNNGVQGGQIWMHNLTEELWPNGGRWIVLITASTASAPC